MPDVACSKTYSLLEIMSNLVPNEDVGPVEPNGDEMAEIMADRAMLDMVSLLFPEIGLLMATVDGLAKSVLSIKDADVVDGVAASESILEMLTQGIDTGCKPKFLLVISDK